MKEQFEDAGQTVVVDGKPRPVLRLGKRLYAGDLLNVLNPNGFGGRVWSASHIDKLQDTVFRTTRPGYDRRREHDGSDT